MPICSRAVTDRWTDQSERMEWSVIHSCCNTCCLCREDEQEEEGESKPTDYSPRAPPPGGPDPLLQRGSGRSGHKDSSIPRLTKAALFEPLPGWQLWLLGQLQHTPHTPTPPQLSSPTFDYSLRMYSASAPRVEKLKFSVSSRNFEWSTKNKNNSLI